MAFSICPSERLRDPYHAAPVHCRGDYLILITVPAPTTGFSPCPKSWRIWRFARNSLLICEITLKQIGGPMENPSLVDRDCCIFLYLWGPLSSTEYEVFLEFPPGYLWLVKFRWCLVSTAWTFDPSAPFFYLPRHRSPRLSPHSYLYPKMLNRLSPKDRPYCFHDESCDGNHLRLWQRYICRVAKPLPICSNKNEAVRDGKCVCKEGYMRESEDHQRMKYKEVRNAATFHATILGREMRVSGSLQLPQKTSISCLYCRCFPIHWSGQLALSTCYLYS